mgnify:CR=1 FL=1
MEHKNLIVPNIGEFKDVEVIEVLVNEGDIIEKNDPLITIESDKSSVEIPSLLSGKIQKLNVKIGDKVSEGSLIAIIAPDEEKQKTINNVISISPAVRLMRKINNTIMQELLDLEDKWIDGEDATINIYDRFKYHGLTNTCLLYTSPSPRD